MPDVANQVAATSQQLPLWWLIGGGVLAGLGIGTLIPQVVNNLMSGRQAKKTTTFLERKEAFIGFLTAHNDLQFLDVDYRLPVNPTDEQIEEQTQVWNAKSKLVQLWKARMLMVCSDECADALENWEKALNQAERPAFKNLLASMRKDLEIPSRPFFE